MLYAAVTEPMVSGMCKSPGAAARSLALSGASLAAKSTVLAVICVITPRLPIPWLFTSTFAPDELYTLAHFAIKGYGKVAPAPKIVVGCGENHPANTPTAIRITATAMTATTIRIRLRPPDRRLSSSASSEGVVISFPPPFHFQSGFPCGRWKPRPSMTVADGVIPVKRCRWDNYIVYGDNALDSIGLRFERRRSEGMEGRKLQLDRKSTRLNSSHSSIS